MSNKDLLKLENEFRNELIKYKEKPNITTVTKPTHLTKKITDFLATSSKDPHSQVKVVPGQRHVEMDITITPHETNDDE